MEHAVSGPVNATAPHPVTNEEFSKTLGQTLGRPALLRTPGFVMRLAFGDMADELLLTGQCVIPHKAQSVITSYSIHYTKLYELSPNCGSTGPNTAFSSMTISSAAREIKVPPDMA